MLPAFRFFCGHAVRASLALWAALALGGAHADSTRLGVDAEYMHDTNATRGPTDADERSDNLYVLEGYAARSLLLDKRSGVIARAGVRLTEHTSFGDLGQLAAAARAAYRIQPSPGFSRPWFEVAAAAQWLRHRESDLRDGFVTGASVGLGAHATDRIRVSLNGGLEKRFADEGALYDLSQNRIWATLDYRIGQSAVTYATVTRLAGDQVFNAISTRGQAWLSPYAEVSALDPALAEGFGGVAPTAYRIDASTRVYELGLNLPLYGNQALDLSASYFDADARQGPGHYDGATFRVAYLYRFR